MPHGHKIHRPCALAALPWPLDHTDGRIVAREVYGQQNGQKRKKRMEVAVGIDGETVNIYDIPTSRLVTSYPIPPQESFTCPPYSIRLRRSDSPDVYRYTYIATRDTNSHKITLFKDVVHPDNQTKSTSTSQLLQVSPIRCLTGSSSTSPAGSIGDLLAICENGHVAHLSGENLELQWTASTQTLVQDAVAGTIDTFETEFVSPGSLDDFRQGMFRTRPEVLSAMPRILDSDPSLVFLIVKSASRGQTLRHAVVLAATHGGSATSSNIQKLIPLDISPLGSQGLSEGLSHVYQVDIHSGLLMELVQGRLTSYDMSGAVPKIKSTIDTDGAQSFIRLSRPFLLSASSTSLVLHNQHYRSIHGRAEIRNTDSSADGHQDRRCQLITYLRSQDLAIALIDNVLVSIHVEPPSHQGRRRKEGLLIDSIGRGTLQEVPTKRAKGSQVSTEFSRLLPNTITESYLAKYQADTREADGLLSDNDLTTWEELLRKRFRVRVREETETLNGIIGENRAAELVEWDWLTQPGLYPATDRRWIIYAISRVFSVENAGSDESATELRLVMPDSNVTTYLVVAGQLTISNLASAFRDELRADGAEDRTLACGLISSLTDADPSMNLLLSYLQATKIGEVELLYAIRSLMLSMDILPDTKKLRSMKLLANESHGDNDAEDMDLDDLERDIAITEHYLGDESSSRSMGLTLAFTKLWRIPAVKAVKALRAIIKTEELLSIIYLLRVELIRGAWTTLYIDPTSFESEGHDPPPDGVITLIADLLGRCLDAVGAGGWLLNDAMSWADKAETCDFLSALKLEATAALEGIEEAVYLNGILSEAVRYGLTVEKNLTVARQVRNPNKPQLVHFESRESRLLPLGLKTKLIPTREKLVSGGEVVQRSARETGHLLSQKVEAYSIEKLAI